MASTAKTPIADRVVVVTGGASGIGEALCKRLVAEGARVVVVADRDAERARAVAKSLGAHAEAAVCDVASEAQVVRMIADIKTRHGRIDVFCSNAGIILPNVKMTDAVSAQCNADWQRIWEINVLSHVYAFRALLPEWRARREGHFLVTASAAGLLSQIGDASYATTKHAAVGFAESAAITHGDEGIRVYCLCPQAVDTPFAKDMPKNNPATVDGVVSADTVAQAVVDAFASGDFLVLPHKQVAKYIARKTQDYNKWIDGMRKWRRSFL